MSVDVFENGYAIVSASESIDLYNAEEFTSALRTAAKDASRGLIIDLSGADYIDSAGVQAVLRAYQEVHSQGGGVSLVLGNANMREIVGVVNLDMLPGMFMREDLASAKQALAEG